MMILIAVVLTGTLAVPHICLDAGGKTSSIEQTIKIGKAGAGHQENSKSPDHCCIAHHCCVAKLVSSTQPVGVIAFVSKHIMPVVEQDRLASFDPKVLDRPPKFFA